MPNDTEIQDIDFNEVAEVNPVLSKFMRLQEIAALDQRYSALKISDVNDKVGYDVVHRARMDVRARRIEVEKVHKEGKADALKHCRDWDAAKNTLIANLEPIESRLASEEKRIDDLIQAEKDRKQQIINDRVRDRQNALLAVNAITAIRREDLPAMDEADFRAHLAVHTATFNEAKRVQAEKDAELEKLRAEAEKRQQEQAAAMEKQRQEMAAQQAEIDRQRKEQEAKAAELRTEAEKIEKSKQAEADRVQREADQKRHAAELEQARKEAAERAAKEATEAAERKQKQEAEAKVKAEAEAKQRATEEAEKATDKEKLNVYLAAVRAVPLPRIKNAKLQGILLNFTNSIVAFDKAI